MDKCEIAVIDWCVVGVKTTEVVDLYMDCAKPEDEYIDCLENLAFRHINFKGGMKYPE